MDFIWLIVGGIAGLLASLIIKTDAQQQGIFLNIVVGIAGALIAGWTISPLLGVGAISQGFSMGALMVSLLGAVTLLAIVNSVWRGSIR
jgi:uncharacterized membrane protein YeaQ/YmgE (transglycosylase-associated protein family)